MSNFKLKKMVRRTDYEDLIRTAHQLGRTSQFGANADYFDGLIRKHIKYNEALKNNSSDIEAKKSEYFIKLGQIGTFITQAIDKAIDNFEDLSNENKEKLNKLEVRLYDSYTIDDIDQVIKEALIIFRSLSKYPR